MSPPISFHARAREEFFAAIDWYEEEREGLGDEFRIAVKELLARIAERPELYGIAYQNVRAAPIKGFPYVLYYRVFANVIRVIAIPHGKRTPARWKRRR